MSVRSYYVSACSTPKIKNDVVFQDVISKRVKRAREGRVLSPAKPAPSPLSPLRTPWTDHDLKLPRYHAKIIMNREANRKERREGKGEGKGRERENYLRYCRLW